MSAPILINRIEIELQLESISHDFEILKISTDLQGKQNFGKVVTAIYQSVQPLSLCKIEKSMYVALIRKGHKYKLNDGHFSLKTVKPGDLSKSVCAKLIIGALPSIMNEEYTASEGIGLYYLSDVEVIKGVEVIRAFEIKLEWEQKKHLVLKIHAATFTPIHYHTNAKGELYADCTHLPRVKFDRWSQELNRSKNGEFIKKKHRDKRMRSEVVSLDTKNPSKFWRTKIGILATFMNDAEKYLRQYLRIQFQTLGPEYRVHFKESDIKIAYEKISELLSLHPINIINLTEANILPLFDALRKDGLTVTQSDTIDSKAANIAIHHQKDYYESQHRIDPYSELRSNRDTVIQSAYPETILKDDKLVRTTYDACKKELFIKWEVAERELKFAIPKGNWSFIICRANNNDELIFITLNCEQGKLAFNALDLPAAQDAFLLDLPRPMKDGDHAVIHLDTGDTFLLEDTNYIALPQYDQLAQVMNELSDGYACGIQREWIVEFLTLLQNGQIQTSNPGLVESRLNNLLLQHRNVDVFYKEQLFKNQDIKIAYKGSFQTFFDWIATEKGLKLGASLKSQESGFIEASLGLFYNEAERLYFVGDKNNVKSIPKFCRIKRILTDSAVVPGELLQMMEVFHIRHKQATIYPFPFKHLREFFTTDYHRSDVGNY